MRLPKSVKMVEVGPRDGLQNEAVSVSVAVKIELIERLAKTGLTVIESGAFVSPKLVPQMADSAEVMANIVRAPGAAYPVLVPNVKGFEAALTAGARDIAIFTAASEAFSRKNTNCSIEESIVRFEPVAAAAKKHGIAMRGYISTVLWCPFEGAIAPDSVAPIAERLLNLGCHEISLGDTIGKGTPGEVESLIAAVTAVVPREKLAVHFHDTYGQALANVLAALENGIAVVDSSVAGLGGCPFAPGATGNVASEDVLYMLDGLNVETGVDLISLIDAGRFICERLGKKPASKVNIAKGKNC